MPEVIFGALTAAIFAGDTLSASAMTGGGLVILCGLLEVWPTKADAGLPQASKTAPQTATDLDCCLGAEAAATCASGAGQPQLAAPSKRLLVQHREVNVVCDDLFAKLHRS